MLEHHWEHLLHGGVAALTSKPSPSEKMSVSQRRLQFFKVLQPRRQGQSVRTEGESRMLR